MKYSYWTGLKKSVIYGVIFLIAAYIDSIVSQDLYGVNQITIGAALVYLRNFLKVKLGTQLI